MNIPANAPPKFRELIEQLENVQASGNGNSWTARCPCHDDGRNSLSLSVADDGKVLIHCHAGCPTAPIVYHCGLSMRDLFPDHGRTKARRGGKSGGEIVETYPYHDEQRNLLFEVCRMEPKDFRQRKPDGKGGWTWRVKGVRKIPFLLPELLAADVTQTVFIVEGEKDVNRLVALGLVATCNAGGAEKWRKEFAQHLAGRNVVVIPDNDQSGESHAADVARSLVGVASSIKIVTLPDLPPKGDVSDWLNAGGTAERLAEIVAGTAEWTPGVGDGTLPADEPKERLNASECDPMETARTFLSEFETHRTEGRTLVFWRGDWWKWTDVKYRKVDVAELRSNLIRFVDVFASNITRSAVSNILQAIEALTLLSSNEEQNSWIHDERPGKIHIAVRNGILDLSAAIAEKDDCLGSHSPAWFSPVSLPYDYDPTADCPLWKRVICQNLENDQEKIDLLQEWFGYCLVPDTDQQKFLVMVGEGGNGKGVVNGALTAVLGLENVSNVPLEVFGERFQLAGTVGKLANIAGDCGELDKVAEAAIKMFTAGDRMTLDRKNKEPIDVIPTARLVLATNVLPRFSDRSDGIWRRMILMRFGVTIQESQKIKGMDKPSFWLDKGELPGMLNWSIAGLCRLRTAGAFTVSREGAKLLDQYRSDCNPAITFLRENYREHPNGSFITRKVYGLYTAWCHENGYRPLANNKFGAEIKRAFPTATKTRVCDDYGARREGYAGITEGGSS